jgi:hypothetical protein
MPEYHNIPESCHVVDRRDDNRFIALPSELEDFGLTPEAYRVYFALKRNQDRPPEDLARRCFLRVPLPIGLKMLAFAIEELVEGNLITKNGDRWQFTQPSEWATGDNNHD